MGATTSACKVRKPGVPTNISSQYLAITWNSEFQNDHCPNYLDLWWSITHFIAPQRLSKRNGWCDGVQATECHRQFLLFHYSQTMCRLELEPKTGVIELILPGTSLEDFLGMITGASSPGQKKGK